MSKGLNELDHVERKVPKYENHKLKESENLGIEEITKGTGIQTHGN